MRFEPITGWFQPSSLIYTRKDRLVMWYMIGKPDQRQHVGKHTSIYSLI